MGYQGTELDRRIAREHFAPLHVVQRPRPVRLEELGRKATPESAAETHVQVNGLWVPKQNLRDATIVSLGAQSHPRGLAYELDAVTRARLCHLQHPHWVMSGWTAAAQWGLEYVVDDAGTSVLPAGSVRSPHPRRRSPEDGKHARSRRSPPTVSTRNSGTCRSRRRC